MLGGVKIQQQGVVWWDCLWKPSSHIPELCPGDQGDFLYFRESTAALTGWMAVLDD